MTGIKRMEEYTVHGFKQVVNVIFFVCVSVHSKHIHKNGICTCHSRQKQF